MSVDDLMQRKLPAQRDVSKCLMGHGKPLLESYKMAWTLVSSIDCVFNLLHLQIVTFANCDTIEAVFYTALILTTKAMQ